MIGVPSSTAVPAANLGFANPGGGEPLTFAEGIGSTYSLVYGTLYGYNGSTNSYSAVGASGTLQPWQAYWIYAFVPTTILIPTT
jgi:hypothetical protein